MTTICETLPLCPDTRLAAGGDAVLTEPVEVGPFSEGVVFLRVADSDPEGDGDGGPRGAVEAEVGISPTGYEDWGAHWVAPESLVAAAPGMHARRVENFGNWLRLRLRLRERGGTGGADEATVLAWFVGKG